ncbi:MAG: hypothetical protein PWP67_1972 [Clostridium butyricum]|jgi:hypothetical protein|nr:hypothetical protein [Clostridium butyricum]
MGSINKILFLLLGATSLFAVPSFKGFLFVHIFLVLAFSSSLVQLLLQSRDKKILFNRQEILIVFLAFLFYASTMIGTINSKAYSGLITSQIFILTFITVLIGYKISNSELLITLLKGFCISAIITSVFCIIDTIYFYINFKPLLETILPDYLMEKANEHTFMNRQLIGNVLVYRSSGLSWDPGLTITGVALAFIIINENIVRFKHKKVILTLSVLAVILSVSKTSIIVLAAYTVLIFLKKYKFNRIQLLNIAAFLLFVLLLYIGLFIDYGKSDPSNERHIKYFSSIFYLYKADLLEIIFGFGYTGVGEFFNKYVDWLQMEPIFVFDKNLNPESTLTNIFMYGGITGSFFWLLTFLFSFRKGNKQIKVFLISLMLLSFGYAINSVWFNSLYITIVLLSLYQSPGRVETKLLHRSS